MTTFRGSFASLELAWVDALETANSATGGTIHNLVSSVEFPSSTDDVSVRAAVDARLTESGNATVGTVAGTIFPSEYYSPPEFSWSPSLSGDQLADLDQAADSLYEAYHQAYGGVRNFRRNWRGTYFSRLVAWPGGENGPLNQLQMRIRSIRGFRNYHAADITVSGDAELRGLQMYASTDRRTRDFPCLSHITISVSDGRLSMIAIYRNWHLISRGYGNLVGLSRLQEFLAQQTGLVVGELMIVAGAANAERGEYGGIPGVRLLAATVKSALGRSHTHQNGDDH